MLQPFTVQHFPLLEKWITDKDILFQYSGTYFQFPVTLKQLADYRKKHPERRFYIGYLANVPYAFGELIPKNDEPPRLARLLIGDPTLRGKGLGEIFVRELITEAKTLFNPPDIDLFVLKGNDQAIRCYQKVGFQFLENEGFTLEFEGQQHQVRKMRLHLKTKHATAS